MFTSSIRVLAMSVSSFVLGWTAVLIGTWVFGLLLNHVVYPEHRWGVELTHVLGVSAKYVAFLLAIAALGLILAIFMKPNPLVQAFIASLGAAAAFAVPILIRDLPSSLVLDFADLIGCFVVLLPVMVLICRALIDRRVGNEE